MAVDQVLLESVESSGTPVIRIYAWAPATLSLGYFQNYRDRSLHAESQGCPVVRRASGGGAILHDNETTYSLCLPSSNRWSKRNTEFYSSVHQCIIDTLEDWDVSLSSHSEEKSEKRVSEESPFLCFQRRSNGDLILDGEKVVGSAQRRAKSALLQHGSVLWEASNFAPQLPGINEIADQIVDTTQFIDGFISRLAQLLELSMQRELLCDSELEQVRHHVSEKFGCDSWTKNRNRE